MRLWIVMLFVMIFIVISGVYMQTSILKTTDQLSQKLDQVQEYVRDDQWQDAIEMCDQITDVWSEKHQYWGPFIHNHDLDVVAAQLARLKSYLEAEEKGSSLAEISTVKVHLVQLHNQEVLTFQNIF